MSLSIKSVILLLAFALMIQNTCPFGAAGRSTVVAACEHCPMKYILTVSADGRTSFVFDSSSVHFPLYVFAVSKMVRTFRFAPIQSVQPPLADWYKDAVPEELLRPPRA